MVMEDAVFIEIAKYLPFLLPLVILSAGLQLFAWIDLIRKKRTRNLSVVVWFLITLINTIGPLMYLILGRAEDVSED